MFDHRQSILIVEDNDQDRELTVHALTSHEIAQNVVAVASANDAMDFLHHRGRYQGHGSRPSLAIIDLHLPDSHGLELVKDIRSNPEYEDLPIVIFTGSQSAIDAAAARQLGANAFMVKPTHWQDMQALVRSTAVFWSQQEQQVA
jgi:CheY-like chemotaxis protein